jgi:general secretion pathway protein G
MLPKRWGAQQGFTLVELIVVVAVLGILVAILVPALLTAVDRSRQRRSMADMTNLAKANAMYQIDVGRYAAALNDLQPAYLQVLPANDAWGTPFQYAPAGNQRTYELRSFGNDGAPGPNPPATWLSEPYDPDIVMDTGTFTQMPVNQ